MSPSPSSTPPKLIVHADDLGLNPCVNRGIIRAFQEGILTSTSFLANFPDSADGARLARENPALEVGLHLNFTEGRPITSAKSLVGPDGNFRRRTAQMVSFMFGRADTGEVVAEAEAQLARARELGLAPTHLDGHEHIHLFGAARRTAASLARREGFVLRRSREPGFAGLDGNANYALRRLILNFLSSGSTWDDLPHAASMVDLTGPGSGRSAEWIVSRVQPLQGVVELMCHPAEAGGPAHDPLRVRRAEELAILTTPGLRARLQTSGINLTTLRSALASRRNTPP